MYDFELTSQCMSLCANVTADTQAAPDKRLEDMMRLGELCIEVLQQNDEHHSEVGTFTVK